MPFAGYDDFDACVRDNSDKGDPEAYCAAIKRQVEGEMEEGDKEIIENEMSQRIAVGRTLQNAGDIERVEKDNGHVRYKNVELLRPGEWTDSKSRTTFYYSEEGIKNSLDNWVDREGNATDKAKLHLNHDGQDTILADIGFVDATTAHQNKHGALVADIEFYCDTDQSKNAERVMNRIYQSDGEFSGDFGPSVEIVDTEDDWDEGRAMYETKEMWFSGAGIVPAPASQTVSFNNQISALANHMAERGVRLMSQSQTDKDTETETESMDEETDESPIQKLRDAREELDRELMDGEYEMAMDVVEAYLGSNETSDSDSVSEMLSWVQENLDDDLASAASMMAEKFAEEQEEDLSEVDVSLFAEFVASMNDGEDEMMEEDEDEEEEEDDMEMGELKERVSELESKISKMRENQGEVVEELSALTETLQGVNKELQAVKDEPQPRALSESLEDDTEDDDGSQPLYAGEMTGTRSFSVR